MTVSAEEDSLYPDESSSFYQIMSSQQPFPRSSADIESSECEEHLIDTINGLGSLHSDLVRNYTENLTLDPEPEKQMGPTLESNYRT